MKLNTFPRGVVLHEDLSKGQITLDDDSEKDVFDVGTLSSSTVQIIESIYVNLTLNDQTNVDFTLYVDVDGSLVAVGGVKNVNSDGGLDLMNTFDVSTPIASSRVRITITGAVAAPGTPGTLDYTLEHQTAS